jgi:hypothetical protein
MSLIRPRWSAVALVCAATTMIPAFGFAEGPPASTASAEQKDGAQKAFVRGKELFGEKKIKEALASFEASLDFVSSPNTRLYIARCHRDLGDLAKAHAAYARTIAEGKAETRYAMAATTAEEEDKDVKAKLGFVRVAVTNAPPGARTTIAGQPQPAGEASSEEGVAVTPGNVEIVVDPGDRPAIKRTVSVGAGATEAVTIDVAPPPPPPPPPEPEKPTSLRPYAYVAGGVAVAGLATFTIFGLLTSSTHSDLEESCGTNPCSADRADDISAGRTQQTIANIGLVVFGVGAAAAATLWILGAPKKTTTARAQIVFRGSALGLEGAF